MKTTPQKKPVFSFFFSKMANKITKTAGKPITFLCALLLIILWAFAGPFFKYSDTWQLVINTSTTIITFLMVFVIQTQNKDTIALHLKLNELISSSKFSSNNLINIEDLTEDELDVLKKFYTKLAALAQKEADIHTSHSLNEAVEKHNDKKNTPLN